MFIIIHIKPMTKLWKLENLGILLTVSVLAVFLFSGVAFAHPGNTAADGCHYCRTNCTKWGVPWNERHCHGGSATPAPTPKPVPVTPAPTNNSTNNTKTDTTVDGRIKDKINLVKNDYPKYHPGFRESLIKDIIGMVGNQTDANKIGYFVYTMLPDVKDTGTDENTFTCNCSKTCPNMSSCAEAQYQLNTCGCTARDADHDGIACDADCQQ
ncbi:MAG: hypothetical protein A3J76_01750 [Candidatus Moranbacteria bacterium RBG_13_45_13]|nr:MAG: hypothetical protein A3J76_01750 [Candidatus Moranbacteria bacterium RBG_13_45_13]